MPGKGDAPYTVWQSASTSLAVTVNGVTYHSAGPPSYRTIDNWWFGPGTEFPPAYYDLFSVEANFEPRWKADGYTQMGLGFGASSSNVFDSAAWALPTSFAGFNVIDFALNGDTDVLCDWGYWGHAEGLVTSFQPVPEPATLLLFCAGLLGAGAARRRHRR